MQFWRWAAKFPGGPLNFNRKATSLYPYSKSGQDGQANQSLYALAPVDSGGIQVHTGVTQLHLVVRPSNKTCTKLLSVE